MTAYFRRICLGSLLGVMAVAAGGAGRRDHSVMAYRSVAGG